MSFSVQGWCPGALRPMMSGDGLVVRIRPRLARLTAAQAQGIADAALRHGNGLIDLSARANIQLRGIRPDTHAALLADLDDLGLIDPDEATEAHRNIVVTPFWTEGDGTADVVATLTEILQSPTYATLPGKFGFAIGPAAILDGVAADIRISPGANGWLVRPDGFDRGALGEVSGLVCILLDWFLASGGVQNGRGRMAGLAASNTPLPPVFDQRVAPTPAPPIPPGPHPLGTLVALEFGQIHATLLAALATTPLRITPWRMLLVEGGTPAHPALITTPGDPRLRVTACTGAPGCPQALQPTRDLARTLATQVPPGHHLHVSGCAKGCAHPKPADICLVATATGFDLIPNGRAHDTPSGAFDAARPLFKAL
jgi:precorrin-3B synthase